MAALLGRRDGVADELEAFLNLLLPAFYLAVLVQRLRSRIDNEQAGIAVDEDVIAGGELGADPVETHDGRDIQGPGHDGRMRGLATDLRGKPEHQERLSDAVSDGVRLCETMMWGLSLEAYPCGPLPSRWRITRRATSSISTTRSRR